MIERLLAAEEALEEGRLDASEKLFRQVAEADARNAMAVVGLGRVAQARGDPAAAAALADRALAIDPEDAAAVRLREETAASPTAVAGAAAFGLGAVPSAATTPARSSRPPVSFVARLSGWLRRMLGRDRPAGG